MATPTPADIRDIFESRMQIILEKAIPHIDQKLTENAGELVSEGCIKFSIERMYSTAASNFKLADHCTTSPSWNEDKMVDVKLANQLIKQIKIYYAENGWKVNVPVGSSPYTLVFKESDSLKAEEIRSKQEEVGRSELLDLEE